jgi:hypothetical protein
MHKIEQLAEQLHRLSTELVMVSSKYVELATQLKDGIGEYADIECTLVGADNKLFAFRLTKQDLTEAGAQKMYETIEANAVGYSTVIGNLWGSVGALSASVTQDLQGSSPVEVAQEAEPEGQVFKVDDDN